MKRVKPLNYLILIRPSKYTCTIIAYGHFCSVIQNFDHRPFLILTKTYFTNPYFQSYRYLVPNDLSAYHFNYIIRKRIKLPETGSLYFFVNGRYLLKGDTLMSDVYNQRKDADGFLYITYTDETTLGGEQ